MTIGWQSLRDSVRLAGTVLLFFYLCVYSWPVNDTGLNWSTYTRIFPNQYLLHPAESLDVELQIQRIYSKIICVFSIAWRSAPLTLHGSMCLKYTCTFFIFYIFRIRLIYLYILNFSFIIYSTFLPGKPHGQRSLAGYSPRGLQKSWTHTQHVQHSKILKVLLKYCLMVVITTHP